MDGGIGVHKGSGRIQSHVEVLILVLMDGSIGVLALGHEQARRQVLILVLMDGGTGG